MAAVEWVGWRVAGARVEHDSDLGGEVFEVQKNVLVNEIW